MSDLFAALGDAAEDRGTALVIAIDELQCLREEELGALIMAIHRTTQLQKPVVLVGAGLPQLSASAGSAKSYAEWLFTFPEIGAFTPAEARLAIVEPASAARVRVDRLTPTEGKYLRAMADLGPGPHRSGEIARGYGAKVESVGPMRS